MNRPKRSKDYSEVRRKVQEAALLIAEGVSEKSAAWKVDLPRASLQRYLTSGKLPDGLPIWPDESTEQSHLVDENGAPDAAQADESLPLLCPIPENEQPIAEATLGSGNLPAQRDSLGHFLPGNTEGNRWTTDARRAKSILAEACPNVARKLVHVFNSLPDNRPDLILAFGKEILDRGIGKPTQSIEVREESLSAEIIFARNVIEHADEATIRQLQGLSVRMEEYTRLNGGAPGEGQVAIIPPPGGTLDNLDVSRFRSDPALDNHDAPTAREK